MIPLRILKDKRGQMMVEFALCLPVFMAFVYGIIGISLWGTAGVIAQNAAHETARKYAVTLDTAQAEKLGSTYIGRGGYLFIDGSSIKVWDGNTTAYSKVTVTPRIKSLFFYKMPIITKESEATLEERFRNPQNYL